VKRRSLLILLYLLSPLSQAQQGSGLAGPPQPPGFLDKNATRPVVEIRPGSIALTRQEIDALIYSSPAAVLRFPSLDRFTGNQESGLEFTRIRMFAPGARLRVLTDQGEAVLAQDNRHYYLASNATTGVGIAVNPDTGEASGFVNRQGSKLEIRGNIISQLQMNAIEDTPAGSNSCSTGLDGQPVEIQQKLESPAFVSASASAEGEVISYQAVVAVDTDSEWLDGFADNPTSAMSWITDAFLAMNVFYERDVETRLLIGDVTLRTGSDPYSVPSNRSDQLDEFGAYWKDNMAQVDRQFAMMLSGRAISGGSFSGIAWIDQFCEYGRSYGSRTVGSFSYNAVGQNRTPGNTAIYLGHELGHNMGSPHTHCYSPPVDGCYNAASGCYSGNPVCPSSGSGTIMSYCHVGGTNGAGCGTSNSEFHPTVQSLIENNLAVELAAGCILSYQEQVDEPEFTSIPDAGSTLDFGSQLLSSQSGPLAIQVNNTGAANLTASCSLSGPDSTSFSVSGCLLNLAASGSSDVSVRCAPVVSGALSASLQMSTNDTDEGNVSFSLFCIGEEQPVEALIFSEGFESNP
jgi:hypothetical protein